MKPLSNNLFSWLALGLNVLFVVALAWWLYLMLQTFTAINKPFDTANTKVEQLKSAELDRLLDKSSN